MKRSLYSVLFAVFVVIVFSGNVFGWFTEAHMFIAQKAGLEYPLSAYWPDVSRNENKDILGPYHYYNAAPDTNIDKDYIDKNSEVSIIIIAEMKNPVEMADPKHNKPDLEGYPNDTFEVIVPNESGALYWKIVALYEEMKQVQKEYQYPTIKKDEFKQLWKKAEYEYYLSCMAHYVGDLSQPLHNYPYEVEPASDGNIYEEIGKWSEGMHLTFDGAFQEYLTWDDEKNMLILKSKYLMKEFDDIGDTISMEPIDDVDDLKDRIADVANSSIEIANDCYTHKDDPDRKGMMTKEQIFKQINLSIDLLQAIMESTKLEE